MAFDIGIEAEEFGMMAMFLAAGILGYVWVSKADDSPAMLRRGAIAGSALAVLAAVVGVRARKLAK